MFAKGDIILPLNRVAREDWLNGLFHPAVVWDEIFDGITDFRGIMITHKIPAKGFDNILMKATHFEEGYEVKYSNSHFVNQVFIKFHDWGPFELVGKLTHDGIGFIETNLTPRFDTLEFYTYRNLLK